MQCSIRVDKQQPQSGRSRREICSGESEREDKGAVFSLSFTQSSAPTDGGEERERERLIPNRNVGLATGQRRRLGAQPALVRRKDCDLFVGASSGALRALFSISVRPPRCGRRTCLSAAAAATPFSFSSPSQGTVPPSSFPKKTQPRRPDVDASVAALIGDGFSDAPPRATSAPPHLEQLWTAEGVRRICFSSFLPLFFSYLAGSMSRRQVWLSKCPPLLSVSMAYFRPL